MPSDKPLNLDKVLGKAKSFINQIGVELEGGWTHLPPGTDLIHDGSVRGLSLPGTPPQPPTDHVGRILRTRAEQVAAERAAAGIAAVGARLLCGEVPSPPMPPEQLVAWMKKFYPHAVNGTCGLHVHMSFKTALQYQRLMTPSYQATILSYITSWAKEQKLNDGHPIWPRLKGESVYCQHKYWADMQAMTRAKSHDQHRPGHRYTAINYCYTSNGTLECRLLPMMDTVDQGISAVQRVLDITNAFLATNREKEGRLKSEVIVEQERLTEHVDERLGEVRRERRQ